MTRAIRRISLVLAILLVALMVNITLIQVFRSDDFRARADNQEVVTFNMVRSRGASEVKVAEKVREEVARIDEAHPELTIEEVEQLFDIRAALSALAAERAARNILAALD